MLQNWLSRKDRWETRWHTSDPMYYQSPLTRGARAIQVTFNPPSDPPTGHRGHPPPIYEQGAGFVAHPERPQSEGTGLFRHKSRMCRDECHSSSSSVPQQTTEEWRCRDSCVPKMPRDRNPKPQAAAYLVSDVYPETCVTVSHPTRNSLSLPSSRSIGPWVSKWL